MIQFPYSLPTKNGDKHSVGNSKHATALIINDAIQRHTGPVLIISDGTQSIERLQHEIDFFQSKQTARKLHCFPDWETLPYDRFCAAENIRSERMHTLYQLCHQQNSVCLAPIHAILHHIAPPSFLLQSMLLVKQGETRPMQRLCQALIQAGYQAVEQVYQQGEFARRGSILDLFPMGSTEPYRLDFFDDEVDSIRLFDPETQRSADPISEINLLPAHEHPFDKEAIAYFRARWRERFSGDLQHQQPYQQISQATVPSGVEYYLPLFFDEPASLFQYLRNDTLIITVGDLQSAIDTYWQELEKRFAEYSHDPEVPLLKPNEICLDQSAFFSHLKCFPCLRLCFEPVPTPKAKDYNLETTTLPTLAIESKRQKPLTALQQFVQQSLSQDRSHVLFCADSPGRQELLLEQFKAHDLRPEKVDNWSGLWQTINAAPTQTHFMITSAALEDSVYLSSNKFVILTESALFGHHTTPQRQKQQKIIDPDAIIKNLTELKVGDAVVHLEQGIGRYLGLKTIETQGQANEYLVLEYANSTKLYVPVTSLHLIHRYTAFGDQPPTLNRLGNEQWHKTRRKAAEKAHDAAVELLALYAKRQAKQGHAFAAPNQDDHSFANEFPFEETADQLSAIAAVQQDMQQQQPMDRLICGDVGFGKTEVAMRAAFLAASNGQQVAILVPTTLLAEQHYQSFQDRFTNWPIRIAALSRFHSAESQKTIDQIAAGSVDIVIGTHKLLSKTIRFKQLGLMIIDEEHRFGVRQKEHLKSLRANVDILTLTATPIPRTLNVAMAGIRDLSIIATPPLKRLAIKTFVCERKDHLIREAILREIMRGGQVYFLHNKVSSIERTAQELEKLIPQATIRTAHGQMRERDLERVMGDFYHHRFNVLVCTTIIETGIDIPAANTILIDRADQLGLAQLHQLRGRVGRSHHQAYAYLLTPPQQAGMTSDAKKRLEAVQAADTLGAGFVLATHDLEIRGAGELLGENQSGHIQSIGFNLYMELLDRAVADLKSGKTPALDDLALNQVEVNLQLPALIPDDYLPEINTRLTLYKRIASAKDDTALDALQAEMIDRFGRLPTACQYLFQVTRLKLQAMTLGICKIDAGSRQGMIVFNDKPSINTEKLIGLIQKQACHYRLEGAKRLKFSFEMAEPGDRITKVQDILALLA